MRKVEDTEHSPTQAGDPTDDRGFRKEAGDADSGESKVETAYVTDEVLILCAINADPAQTEAWEALVEGMGKELRPYAYIEAYDHG